MKLYNLKDMVRGWFVGNFDPSIIKTEAIEVGIKEYGAGDYEKAHYHKVATEVTVIMQGEVEMNGVRYVVGDIIVLYPDEVCDFKAITKATTTVVKFPGENNDKYEV
jgi:hypothetical protein